jgi:hypothetical protein
MMKIGPAVAAAAVFAIASPVCAQDAVQWRVEDGGNGHWYKVEEITSPNWIQAQSHCASVGGHLITITSQAEQQFAAGLAFATTPQVVNDCWLGGFQDRTAPDFHEPAGGWRWVTGEPWIFTAWRPDGQPTNVTGLNDYLACTTVPQDALGWVDSAVNHRPGNCNPFVEWSADCNGDGIVDYGQCRDGTLPDYDGNYIPDCCDQGQPCVVGNYPVQWRVMDGGNGHWYAALRPATPLNWAASERLVASRGAYLPTIRSAAENDFMLRLTLAAWTASDVSSGPFLGGRRGSASSSVACEGWVWVTGEPFDFIADFPAGNSSGYGPCGTVCNCMNKLYNFEPVLAYWGVQFPVWNSQAESNTSAVVLYEWSADCNGDGIVDYGQIRDGTFPDVNANGVPDCCDQAESCTPCPGDVTKGGTVNAADLSILLAAWGTNGQGEFDTDLNGDGLVDGGDLALVLGGWGACP